MAINYMDDQTGAQRNAGRGGNPRIGITYNNPKYDKLLKTQDIFEQLRQLQRATAANAYQASRQGLRSIQSGYQNALAATSTAGDAARTETVARGQKTQAAGEQSLVSRGLGNTTALQNLTRAVGSDTTRSLAAIDSTIAGILSGLHAQKGEAEARAHGQLANTLLSTTGQQTDLGLSYIASLLGQQRQSSGGGLADLAQLATLAFI